MHMMKVKNQNDATAFYEWCAVFVVVFLCFTNGYAQSDAVINPDSTHQLIRGFGGANILQWRPDMTDSEIETAFGTDDGQLGFSILRLRIQPDVTQWETNVPTALKAHDMGVTIIASPWNPPEGMLDPDSDQRRLSPEWYEDYAYHLDDFVWFMDDNGVPIYAVSIQNEPDYGDWTQWTAGEMVTFMGEYAADIGTQIIAPESFQFRRPFTDAILNDSAACAELDIVGGHIYGGGLAPYPLAESKGKEVWMTEHYTDSENSGNLWPLAMDVGLDIHKVMAAGMNAYIWWYIVRFYGPISDGTMDSGEKGDVTKRGYIMSHYSRFIRPGYYRVECNPMPQSSVYVTAYKDPASSKMVIVAINNSTREKNQAFTFENNQVNVLTPYVTSETKNCELASDIPISNNKFQATLDEKSITTFIGDMSSSAVENRTTIPGSFRLYQNYPNPFNPSTCIRFEIPKKSFVCLKVYDVLGNEVDELAGNMYAAGGHSVAFDGAHLANGVYFYKLEANNQVQSKKLIIMK